MENNEPVNKDVFTMIDRAMTADKGCGSDIGTGNGRCRSGRHCEPCYQWLYDNPGKTLNNTKPEPTTSGAAHYTQGDLQVIDVIEKWNLNRNLAQVVAYVLRCDHKGQRNHDLEKAIDYLHRERYGTWATLPERTKK